MTRLIAGGFVVIVLIETLVFVIDPHLAAPVTGIAVAGFVLLAAGRLSTGADDPTPGAADDAAESLRRWRAQTEALIAWADSTRGDWDRHLRPRLAREFMMATGRPDTATGRPDTATGRPGTDPGADPETGRMVFGDDLWRWVDPREVTRTERDAPGPGREALEEILRRLERI